MFECFAVPIVAARMPAHSAARQWVAGVPNDTQAGTAVFRADDAPTMDAEVLDRTQVADRILAGLLAALGTAVAGCALVVLRSQSRWGWWLVALAAIVWLLRSRAYAGAAQRVAMMLPGVVILGLLGVRVGANGSRSVQLLAGAVLALATVGCLAFSARVDRARHSPYVARLLDIVELLAIIAVLPITGAVIGVYSTLRNIGR